MEYAFDKASSIDLTQDKQLQSPTPQIQNNYKNQVLLNNKMGSRYSFVMLNESLLIKIPNQPEKFTREHFENSSHQTIQKAESMKQNILDYNADVKKYDSLLAFHSNALQNGHYEKIMEENKKLGIKQNPAEKMENFLNEMRTNLLDRQANIAHALDISHTRPQHSNQNEKLLSQSKQILNSHNLSTMPASNFEAYIFNPEKNTQIAKALQNGAMLSHLVKSNEIKQTVVDKQTLSEMLTDKDLQSKTKVLFEQIPNRDYSQSHSQDNKKLHNQEHNQDNKNFHAQNRNQDNKNLYAQNPHKDHSNEQDIQKVPQNISNTEHSKTPQSTGNPANNIEKKEHHHESQLIYDSTPASSNISSISMSSNWDHDVIEGMHGPELYHFNKQEKNKDIRISTSEDYSVGKLQSPPSIQNGDTKSPKQGLTPNNAIKSLNPTEKKVFNAIYNSVVKTSNETEHLMKKRRDILEHELGDNKDFKQMTLSQRRQLKQLALGAASSNGEKIAKNSDYHGMTPKNDKDNAQLDISMTNAKPKLQMNKVK